MNIVNCTPHPVRIYTEQGVTELTKGEVVPRLSVSREQVKHPLSEATPMFRMQVVRPTLGNVENLPEKEDGVYLLVSALVLNHPSTSHRDDLIAPGELLRDDEGNIIGCNGVTVRSENPSQQKLKHLIEEIEKWRKINLGP